MQELRLSKICSMVVGGGGCSLKGDKHTTHFGSLKTTHTLTLNLIVHYTKQGILNVTPNVF